MATQEWIAHTYPLQQFSLRVELQGTRHSARADVIGQLEEVVVRLKSGELAGEEHDDDFGYRFTLEQAESPASLFDTPAGKR
jgi:hypothetical protein